MSDLGNRANVDSAINLLLDDLQPNEAIQPSDHNTLLKNILDTLSNGLSTVLRTGNTTDGQNLTITSSSIFQFNNGSSGRLQSDTLTAFRNWTLPNTSGTVAMLSDITGGGNISNADLTFDGDHYADLNGNSWQLKDSTGANRLLLDVQKGNANGHGIGYGGAAVDGKHTFYNTTTNSTQALCNMTYDSGLKLSGGTLQNDYLNFGSAGFILHIKSNVSYGSSIGVYPDIKLTTRHSSSGIVFDTNNFINFKKNTVAHSIIDSSSRWILRGSAVIGVEKISLQDDTLIKGSDNSASTSGFKVTDINNVSLLDVKNSGQINIGSLPTSSAGLSSGDIWNNSGVLNIV